MNFEFPTSWDAAEYSRGAYAVSRYRLRQKFLHWLPELGFGFVLLTLLIPGMVFREGRVRADGIFLLAFAPLGYVYLRFVAPRVIRKRVQQGDPDLAKGYIRRFTADEFQLVGESAKVQVAWPRFLAVEETREFFLFYFTPHSAYYLPKRVIAGALALGQVREFLRARVGDRFATIPD